LGLRQQEIDRLADKLLTTVTELLFKLPVDEHDRAVGIRDENAASSRFNRHSERGFGPGVEPRQHEVLSGGDLRMLR
jgi:hypothetical protein